PEMFARCGFDDRDVVGDLRAGDVDAELESAADDISNRTWRGGRGRLHGRALGVGDLEEFPSSPKVRPSFITDTRHAGTASRTLKPEEPHYEHECCCRGRKDMHRMSSREAFG